MQLSRQVSRQVPEAKASTAAVAAADSLSLDVAHNQCSPHWMQGARQVIRAKPTDCLKMY